MKYCQSCNHPMSDDAAFCGNCGTAYAPAQAPVQQEPVYAPPAQQAPAYTPPVQQAYTQPAQPQPDADPYDINVTHKGFWSLGFFFGIVGLILYFVLKPTKPRLAKSALKGFIAGLIVAAVFFTIYIIGIVAAMMM